MIRAIIAAAILGFGPIHGLSGTSVEHGYGQNPLLHSLSSGVWLAGSTASDQIRSKIVVTERTRRGEELEIRFRIEFDNLVLGKRYKLFFWTGYMEKKGTPETDLSKTFGIWTPTQKQAAAMEYGVILYKGEWIQITLRSLDGEVKKAFRFVLFK